ncbi:MAG: lipopolysaccharide transport periplasmic protein LptA, partial [Gammaproteobacteria bacterium]|nr:lipopolysaccharide transport periplasmic protein LptA [Gammaproteobacteria bacterium]
EKSGVSTYTGDVKLEQGSIRINADSIVVYTHNKKLQRIIASGTPARFSQKPDHQTENVHASAEHVEYSSVNGLLILLSNANMQQGSNLFSGNKIEYDTVNDILSAKSSQKSNQRVKAVIQPETLRNTKKK